MPGEAVPQSGYNPNKRGGRVTTAGSAKVTGQTAEPAASAKVNLPDSVSQDVQGHCRELRTHFWRLTGELRDYDTANTAASWLRYIASLFTTKQEGQTDAERKAEIAGVMQFALRESEFWMERIRRFYRTMEADDPMVAFCKLYEKLRAEYLIERDKRTLQSQKHAPDSPAKEYEKHKVNIGLQQDLLFERMRQKYGK